MVVLRSQGKIAFDHVLDVLLDCDSTSGLKRSLLSRGYTSLPKLLCIDYSVIDSLTYDERSDSDENASSVAVPVPQADKDSLKMFFKYVAYRHQRGHPINDDWTSITTDDFDSFCVRRDLLTTHADYTPLHTPSSTLESSVAVKPVMTAADAFRRGIKRDPTLFPSLKNESYNDSWHRSFVTQARAQNVSDVLDDQYTPTSEEDKDLFDEKQKYMYAVLEATVLTDQGKAIVRKYESTYDAQAVYSELKRHHLQSTKAKMESSSILAYITTAKLGDGTWNGTTNGFILHWMDNVRRYEQISGETISDKQKRALLENAVSPIADFRQVKSSVDIDTAKTGNDAMFGQYCALLLSQSTTYDAQFSSRPCRKVMLHEFSQDDAYFEGDDDFAYDIDSPVTALQVHAATRRQNRNRFPPPRPSGNTSASSGPRTRMSHDQWMQLSDDARTIWDSLSDKDKAIILGSSPHGASPAPLPTRRTVNWHESQTTDAGEAAPESSSPSEEFHDASQDIDSPQEAETTLLVNAAARSNSSNLDPRDIRRIMSRSSSARSANVHMMYRVSNQQLLSPLASLIDRGANGGVAGCDVRVIEKAFPHRRVDIQGIDNHQMTDLEIGTVGGVVRTHKGPVIAIFHQYALYGKGPSIHAAGQLEHYKNFVDDKSAVVGGHQSITTLDGYVIPLNFQQGLARLPLRPYTDAEWDTLPHVFMTSDIDWDPSVLDNIIDDEDVRWYDAVSTEAESPPQPTFNEFGDYRFRVNVQHAFRYVPFGDDVIDDVIDHCIYSVHDLETQIARAPDIVIPALPPGEPPPIHTITPRTLTQRSPDFARLRPYFGWISADLVKLTLEHTTQYARIPTGTLLKRAYKSANPALNVRRRSEAVACDIVYSDTPTIGSGATSAVLFCGRDTYVTDIYGIKTDKQFINTLEDNIRERGAPTRRLSDRAQVEISKAVLNILRTFCIDSWQSEPKNQQQNFAERRFQTIKTTTNRILDRTGAPASTWLLCLQYVCFLLNHTYNETLKTVPIQALTGSTPDVSILLRFYYWQKVLYMRDDYDFPSESPEAMGHIVGISEHVGPALCWKILTSDTQKVIFRSQVRPYTDDDPNLRAAPTDGESSPSSTPVVQSRTPAFEVDADATANFSPPDATVSPHVPIIDVDDLVGRTFLMDEESDGQRFRARISHIVKDHEAAVRNDPTRT